MQTLFGRRPAPAKVCIAAAVLVFAGAASAAEPSSESASPADFGDELVEALLPLEPLEPPDGPEIGVIQQFDESFEETIGSRSWERHLPVFGEDFREQGIRILPPFGFSFVASYFKQDIFVDNIRIGGLDLGDDVRVPKSTQTSRNLFFRADMFVLPFLSVYGLVGHSAVESETQIVAAPFNIDRSAKRDFGGPLFGGGAALPLQYENVFVLFDGGFTFADTGAGENATRTTLFATRAGYRFHFGDTSASLYLGTLMMNYRQTVQSSLPFGATELDFVVDVKNENPWNMLTGIQFFVGRHGVVLLEGGYIGRTQINGSLMFRF